MQLQHLSVGRLVNNYLVSTWSCQIRTWTLPVVVLCSPFEDHCYTFFKFTLLYFLFSSLLCLFIFQCLTNSSYHSVSLFFVFCYQSKVMHFFLSFFFFYFAVLKSDVTRDNTGSKLYPDQLQLGIGLYGNDPARFTALLIGVRAKKGTRAQVFSL